MLQDTGNTSLPVSFQQLVLHTPVDLLREKEREREREERGERGGGGLSMKKDINLRRERVNGCLVFLLVLFCTPSVSNRSWLLHKECYKIQETLACLSPSNN